MWAISKLNIRVKLGLKFKYTRFKSISTLVFTLFLHLLSVIFLLWNAEILINLCHWFFKHFYFKDYKQFPFIWRIDFFNCKTCVLLDSLKSKQHPIMKGILLFVVIIFEGFNFCGNKIDLVELKFQKVKKYFCLSFIFITYSCLPFHPCEKLSSTLNFFSTLFQSLSKLNQESLVEKLQDRVTVLFIQ